MDIKIANRAAGRIVMELRADVVPKTAGEIEEEKCIKSRCVCVVCQAPDWCGASNSKSRCMCVCVCLSLGLHVCVCVCLHLRMCVHICLCVCVCMCVCAYSCMCVTDREILWHGTSVIDWWKRLNCLIVLELRSRRTKCSVHFCGLWHPLPTGHWHDSHARLLPLLSGLCQACLLHLHVFLYGAKFSKRTVWG